MPASAGSCFFILFQPSSSLHASCARSWIRRNMNRCKRRSRKVQKEWMEKTMEMKKADRNTMRKLVDGIRDRITMMSSYKRKEDNMFGKGLKEKYILVPVCRPTFAISSRGKFYRVDNFVILFRAGKPSKELFVTDDGLCETRNECVRIFSSPLSREWGTYTAEYFDQCCRRFGVEVHDRDLGPNNRG